MKQRRRVKTMKVNKHGIFLFCFALLSTAALTACQQQTTSEKPQQHEDNVIKSTTDAVHNTSEQVNKAMKTSNDMLQNAQKDLNDADDSLNEAEETLDEARKNSGNMIAPEAVP